jgi:hypothetical protein
MAPCVISLDAARKMKRAGLREVPALLPVLLPVLLPMLLPVLLLALLPLPASAQLFANCATFATHTTGCLGSLTSQHCPDETQEIGSASSNCFLFFYVYSCRYCSACAPGFALTGNSPSHRCTACTGNTYPSGSQCLSCTPTF